METIRVKKLRELYGLYEKNIELTEEQLECLSKKMIYYVSFAIDTYSKSIDISYKHIPGYLSVGSDSCIYIKDLEITGNPWYMPKKSMNRCEKLKDGIYQDINIIYCLTDELEFCLKHARNCLQEELDTLIEEAEDDLKALKGLKSQLLDQ